MMRFNAGRRTEEVGRWGQGSGIYSKPLTGEKETRITPHTFLSELVSAVVWATVKHSAINQSCRSDSTLQSSKLLFLLLPGWLTWQPRCGWVSRHQVLSGLDLGNWGWLRTWSESQFLCAVGAASPSLTGQAACSRMYCNKEPRLEFDQLSRFAQNWLGFITILGNLCNIKWWGPRMLDKSEEWPCAEWARDGTKRKPLGLHHHCKWGQVGVCV